MSSLKEVEVLLDTSREANYCNIFSEQQKYQEKFKQFLIRYYK